MPEPLALHQGIALPLLRENIDTDQIIPSREMRSIDRSSLAQGLFAGWRYLDAERTPNPDFVFNDPAYAGASILLAGANFGCGSSREHAVWALAEAGFRVVIAPSFGEIFFGNCLRNGVAPVQLEEAEVRFLARHVAEEPRRRRLSVDVVRLTIAVEGAEGWSRGFHLEPFARRLLSEGLDPIGLTLELRAEIEAFEREARPRQPWIYRD